MREIHAIVVHGAWTHPHDDIGAEEIRHWHIGRSFRDIGYHFVIRRDGKVEKGRPVEEEGAHVKGHNADTIGICLVGGRDSHPVPEGVSELAKQEVQWEFNYTEDQIDSLVELVRELQVKHGATDVLGHRDYRGVAKRCPGFDVRAFFG